MSTATLPRSRPGRLPDHYADLGVPEDASFGDIQAAYWEKAKRCRDQLPLLNAAYEALGDQRRRAAYDAQRRAAGVPARPQGLQPAGWQSSRLRDKLGMFLS